MRLQKRERGQVKFYPLEGGGEFVSMLKQGRGHLWEIRHGALKLESY